MTDDVARKRVADRLAAHLVGTPGWDGMFHAAAVSGGGDCSSRRADVLTGSIGVCGCRFVPRITHRDPLARRRRGALFASWRGGCRGRSIRRRRGRARDLRNRLHL